MPCSQGSMVGVCIGGSAVPILHFRVLFDLVQPEIGGAVPAVFLQDLVRGGHGLGGQLVKVSVVVIGIKIPRLIAVQLG